MKQRRFFARIAAAALLTLAAINLSYLSPCADAQTRRENTSMSNKTTRDEKTTTDKTKTTDEKLLQPLPKNDADWKKRLSPEQYAVLRHKGTEPAFTGKYWNNHDRGVYRCAGCGQPLFKSDDKFESGSGWPSFWEPYYRSSVTAKADDSHFMHRTEVLCSRCGGHLGHVFNDGPQPTGLRYCINSAALKLDETAQPAKSD
jgi:peptide-methionine (R)-S-oxide reductase